MFMRISKSTVFLPLIGVCLAAGCHRASPDAAPAGERISCAIGGSNFANDCTLEDSKAGTLTIHHPDGGFRRFVIDRQEKIDAADGAETASSTRRADGRTEVQIGPDRYVIGQASAPATPR